MNAVSTKRKTKGGPDPVDKHVGQRIRARRSLLGISQERLAESVGVTFQQIQKYESGTNRVSAGRLYQLSNILQIPVTYFYEQFGKEVMEYASMGMSYNTQEAFEQQKDVMKEKETINLVRTYYKIKDPEARKDILKFVKSMADRFADKN